MAGGDTIAEMEMRVVTVRFVAVMVLFWAALYVYIPVLSPLAAERGASLRLIGIIVGSYGVVLFVSRIPLGIWSDRRNARAAFVRAGFVASVVGSLGLAYFDAPLLMIVFRGATGVTAAMWVMLTVLFASHFPVERTAEAMGVAITCSYLSQTVATLLGGAVAQQWGWEAPFAAAAALSVMGLLLSRGLTEGPFAASDVPTKEEIIGVVRNPTVLLVSLLAALALGVQLMTIYGFTPVLASRHGAGPATLGVLAFVSTAALAGSSFVSGKYLSRRVARRSIILAGFVLLAVFTPLVPVSASLLAIGAFQSVAAVGIGLVLTPLTALCLEAVPSRLRATAMALFQAIYSLGIFGGPIIAGAAAEAYGLTSAFLAALAFSLLGIAVSILTWRLM